MRIKLFLLAVLLLPSAFSSANVWFSTPDNTYYKDAIEAIEDRLYTAAMSKFRKAAAYGNKEAQLALGMMYLSGYGDVNKNKLLAYAWYTHAASTGLAEANKYSLLTKSMLSDEQLQAAQSHYEQISEAYSDVKALNKRALWVKRAKRKITGSRVGFVGALRIYLPGNFGSISGDKYYGYLDSYQNELAIYDGNVELGELTVIDEEED